VGRRLTTNAWVGSVARLSSALSGVLLARLHAGVFLRVGLVIVERHRTNVSISCRCVKVRGGVPGTCCARARWWSDGRGSPADLLRPSDWFPRSHRPLTSPRMGSSPRLDVGAHG